MEIKNVNIHIGNLIGAMAALVIAFLTGQGTLQNYISFAGIANEIGFFVLSMFAFVSLLICSFSKTSK
jgi:hypothetical protein